MKKFLKYWLPAIAVMALVFPVGNKALASPRVYEVFMAVVHAVFPHISRRAAGRAYILFRKTGHFITYGLIASLVFRALRAGRGRRWRPDLLIAAAGIAAGYAFLDEFLQSFVPNRTGSPIDWAVDCAGIALALLVAGRRARRMDRGESRPPRPNSPSRALFLKRPFDIALSSAGLVLSSPLWAAVSLAVWLEDRGPVFYAQERVGRGGRTFRALKFRSMVRDAEKDLGPVQAAENDPRVTRVGRILRGTAMDELPQLLNILRGHMSFVGPRALRPSEIEVNGKNRRVPLEDVPGYRDRHAVRPGLTGLAQVFLPGDAPRRKKFRYDLLYIRKMSFWADLEIILLSFWITFRGRWEFRGAKVRLGRRRH